METRNQECQKLSNDLLGTQEHNNKLKEEVQRCKDTLKSTNQQHDVLAKDLITKLEGEEEKQIYLENKMQLLADQNKTLQRMLEETPVEKLKPDFDQSSENKVLLESLKNERVARKDAESSLKNALESLEQAAKELENELVSKQDSKRRSLDRVEEINSQLTQLEEKLDEEQMANTALQEQIGDLTSEMKFANKTKYKLQKSLDEKNALHAQEKGDLEKQIQQLVEEDSEKKRIDEVS